MLPAIILFAVTYVLMIAFGKYRPYIALTSGVLFIILGMLPVNQIIGSLDFNVLLMIGGTMGLVQLFIDSRMPERLFESKYGINRNRSKYRKYGRNRSKHRKYGRNGNRSKYRKYRRNRNRSKYRKYRRNRDRRNYRKYQ